MSKPISCKLTQLSKQLALAGLLGASSLVLSACHDGQPKIVKCVGVPVKTGKTLYIEAGICKKLGGGKPIPVQCSKWSSVKNNTIQCLSPNNKLAAQKYSANSYIKCYGVAAAGMNDCGTKTTACGGSVHTPRQKDAWIAIPKGICKQIKGSIIGKIGQ